MKTPLFVLLLVCGSLFTSAHAATTYIVSGTFNGTTFGGISIGDAFEVVVTIEESITDTTSSNREATFVNAVTQFDVDIDSGTFTFASSGTDLIQGDDDPFFNFDSITVFAPGAFPELGGFQIENMFLDFEVSYNDGPPVDDDGLGQTYSEMVSSIAIAGAWDNYSDADFVIRGEFGLSMSGDIVNVQVVPEASSAACLGLAALGCVFRRRRRA